MRYIIVVPMSGVHSTGCSVSWCQLISHNFLFEYVKYIASPLSVAKEVKVETDQSDHAEVMSSECLIGSTCSSLAASARKCITSYYIVDGLNMFIAVNATSEPLCCNQSSPNFVAWWEKKCLYSYSLYINHDIVAMLLSAFAWHFPLNALAN